LGPLQESCRRGFEECALLLLEARADASGRENDGGTPLHVSAHGGHAAVTLLLVEHGPFVLAQDKDECTHAPPYLEGRFLRGPLIVMVGNRSE